MYIDIETLITTIYFVVNNWYLREGHCYLDGKVGRKPTFTDTANGVPVAFELVPANTDERGASS